MVLTEYRSYDMKKVNFEFKMYKELKQLNKNIEGLVRSVEMQARAFNDRERKWESLLEEKLIGREYDSEIHDLSWVRRMIYLAGSSD